VGGQNSKLLRVWNSLDLTRRDKIIPQQKRAVVRSVQYFALIDKHIDTLSFSRKEEPCLGDLLAATGWGRHHLSLC